MRSLFDQLVTEGEGGLQRLIDERVQENVQLDFKTKGDRTRGRFGDDDKKVFGKALSAFANSAGGLIIWGVDCRKGADGLDCAQELMPINEIEQFYSEAVRLSGDLIVPRHDGIQVKKIPSSKHPGSGYILVQVDRSERRPHRSEAKGDKQYYKRAGESSYAMEHYDIEDAFKRITAPFLELGVRFIRSITDGNGRVLSGSIELYLSNPSLVTARMPYLQERETFGARLNNRRPDQVTHTTEGEWLSHAGDISAVIHPGLSRTMAIYDLSFSWEKSCNIEGKRSNEWSFYTECRFGCENLAVTEKTIELNERYLISQLQR